MYKIETERGDLFDVNMMIVMKAAVSGAEGLSFAEAEKAFGEAIAAYEILNSKIMMKADGSCFYEPFSSGAEATGQDGAQKAVQSAPADNAPDGQPLHNPAQTQTISPCSMMLEELIQQQQRIRFRLEDGEFLRCFVYEPCDGKRDFVFLMHHLGGDGKSLCYFIETFLNCLCVSGKTPEYQPIKLLTSANLPKDSALPFAAKLLAKHYNKQWQKEQGKKAKQPQVQERCFSFKDMQTAYDYFWQNHRTTISVQYTDAAALQQELAECKRHGIGYTSYTIAKLLKDESGKKSVGLAVDARPDGNRTMSNQATGISVDYAYDSRKTLIENAACIDKLMKAKFAKPALKYFILQFMAAFEPPLVDAVNLEFAGCFHSKTSAKLAKLLGYGTNTKDFSITNLTKLDISTEYSGSRASLKIEDFVFVPPVVSYGKNIIGMVTLNGRLCTVQHRYEN